MRTLHHQSTLWQQAVSLLRCAFESQIVLVCAPLLWPCAQDLPCGPQHWYGILQMPRLQSQLRGGAGCTIAFGHSRGLCWSATPASMLRLLCSATARVHLPHWKPAACCCLCGSARTSIQLVRSLRFTRRRARQKRYVCDRAQNDIGLPCADIETRASCGAAAAPPAPACAPRRGRRR